MKLHWHAMSRHALVLAAVAAGMVGMSMIFGGLMHGNLGEVSRGTPLLLIGLWWSGRELGRSIDASRARTALEEGRSASRLQL